ncbi:MAG: hypothetical protein EXS43_12440 [Opitutus sp.]|nr:hypothetical protein [Opitutus sp.]
MRKKLSIVGLLVAWLCANGALLDVVQVFAWGRMFAGYAESMTVGAALSATFDPAKPCELCVSVAQTKDQQEKQAPAELLRAKDHPLVLACDLPAAIVFSAPNQEWPAGPALAPPGRNDPVPVPPPRV